MVKYKKVGDKMYKCPVCQNALHKENNTYKCINNHSYDISSYGYTNLLLANQHHSLNPGDSKEMINSRVRFFKNDPYKILKEFLSNLINELFKNETIDFCDIACGEGYYTTFIHQNYPGIINTTGVDISKYGIIECCKKAKNLKLNNINFCIGNLANLPFLDHSFNILLNCFAPMDVKEFNRVLKDNGYYIRVLPDKYHLFELKEVLYDNVILNVMKEVNLEGFKLQETYHINDKILLNNFEQIYDLFTMTPYYYKSSLSSISKLKKLNSLNLTIAFTILLYKKEN